MTINNMLPPRGHNPERLETDARSLRAMVETCEAPAARKWLRRMGVPLAVTVGIAGVGSAAAAAILGLGHLENGPYGKSYPVSTNLQMTISAEHGPVGTVVNIHATGCYDPMHVDHSVSFVSDATAPEGEMQREHDIAVSTSNGSTFTGAFTIPSDATANAQFWFTCGASTKKLPFHVINPVTAPACGASDVAATMAAGGGAAAGHFIIPVTFRNVGGHTCWLKGIPQQVRLATTGGQVYPATHDGFVDGPSSTPMAPGHTTTMRIDVTEECAARPAGGPPVTRTGQVETLVGTRWVQAAGGLNRWDIGCGIGYGNYTNN